MAFEAENRSTNETGPGLEPENLPGPTAAVDPRIATLRALVANLDPGNPTNRTLAMLVRMMLGDDEPAPDAPMEG